MFSSPSPSCSTPLALPAAAFGGAEAPNPREKKQLLKVGDPQSTSGSGAAWVPSPPHSPASAKWTKAAIHPHNVDFR